MRVPNASYRIQLNHAFDFRAAKKIISYLEDLGISDVYASPIFRAKRRSLHGYDVVDPNELNPEIGPITEFKRLRDELKEHGMGWLQDIVPNHMAFDSENRMLMDVFENGKNSQYFNFFDVNWDLGGNGKLLAPFLGKFYGEALEEGEISLKYGPEGLAVKYYDFKFPLRMETYVDVFTYRLDSLREALGEGHPDFIRFLGTLYVLQALPSREDIDERYEQIRVIKRTLWQLYNENAEIKGFVDKNMRIFNGEKGSSGSFNLLDDLLTEQVFRFSFWKVAYEEINYRRFFSINALISLKLEDEGVFDHVHALTFKMIESGNFTGLRVDHIDGLYDPACYLKKLRERTGDVYIVVEKILDLNEKLPRLWPIQGTTGYDFLNHVNGIFCRREKERLLDKIYGDFTTTRISYDDLVFEKKKLIIETHMGGDVDNLAGLLKKISGRERHGRDTTLYGLRRALVEILAQFPVYRTYVNREEEISESDREYIQEAARRAGGNKPGMIYEIDFIRRFFLLDFAGLITPEERKQRVQFVMRFQQFTGPLMAKGFEDTMLYVYNRLLSLNEVGGSPDKFGVSLGEFHEFNRRRAADWPHSLNATSTHDTKRGEDVRARINVLSEMPGEWELNVKKWHKLNRRKKKKVNGINVPDKNDEYFLYQTLIGTWPFDAFDDSYVERIKKYAIKVVREAKVHTAWLKPDTDYENAFVSFMEEILKPDETNRFPKEFLPFQRTVAHYGIFNSLSQVLIKMTAPGVPDFYQGSELWDLNLVDPDNRRPVDYEKRMAMLLEIREKARSNVLRLISELLASIEDGRIKLFLIYKTLTARREKSSVFMNGSYIPLETEGKLKEHLVVFARNRGNDWAVTVAPRFFKELIREGENPLGPEVWNDTHVLLSPDSPRTWRNVITDQFVGIGDRLPVAETFKHFPAALLVSEENP